MATIVTSEGRVTIPQEVRDMLGIGPGSTVEFRIDSTGRVLVEKIDSEHPKSRIEALRGIAGPGPSTDEIMAMTRGED